MHERFAIRCELDGRHPALAPALARSLVHHQCRLVDVDVATTEALEAAASEVVDDLTDATGTIVEIGVDPQFAGVDIRIITRFERADPAHFVFGPIAAATFDELAIDGRGRVHLVHQFPPDPGT